MSLWTISENPGGIRSGILTGKVSPSLPGARAIGTRILDSKEDPELSDHGDIVSDGAKVLRCLSRDVSTGNNMMGLPLDYTG